MPRCDEGTLRSPLPQPVHRRQDPHDGLEPLRLDQLPDLHLAGADIGRYHPIHREIDVSDQRVAHQEVMGPTGGETMLSQQGGDLGDMTEVVGDAVGQHLALAGSLRSS